MKILLTTQVFEPSVGGVEEISRLLAQAFSNAGHEVCVSTQTLAQNEGAAAYRVSRGSSWSVLRRKVKEADVCLMLGGPSLRNAAAVLTTRRPIVISHQIPYEKFSYSLTPKAALTSIKYLSKTALSKYSTNIFASTYMKDQTNLNGYVIRNPFDSDRFVGYSHIRKQRDIVFVGRMIPDKGAMKLAEALALLATQDELRTATFVGDGPERVDVEEFVRGCGLGGFVEFKGLMRGDALAEEVARHRVMVVPSIWPEPFGIVALEGMAAGCAVIGSCVGGLPEAIGEGGMVIPPDSAQTIASGVREILDNHDLRKKFHKKAQDHIARHRPDIIAAEYITVMERAIQVYISPNRRPCI